MRVLLLAKRCVEGEDTESDNLVVILGIDNNSVNVAVSATTEWKAMATVKQRKGASRVASSKGGAAVAELMLEVAQFFFRLRALGQRTGLITSWGAGTFGFMRSLALIGPLTVPQIAQMRPTSRQRMQRLADELAADGLVEFIDNPRHRRSKLVRLTRKGHTRYRELNARLLEIASTMGADLSEVDVRKTTEIVRRLSDETKDAGRQSQGLRQQMDTRKRSHARACR
jgi:DNA-binding MarR family transcriptional regulator